MSHLLGSKQDLHLQQNHLHTKFVCHCMLSRNFEIKGIVAKAYIHIASGSSCAVPSLDHKESPPTKRLEGL